MSFHFNSESVHMISCNNSTFTYFMPRSRKEGAISVALVRLSLCTSVAYIANNSRTQRPSVPKFGMKVPHLRCDSHPVSSSNGQRSASPGPLMLIHIVRHIFRMARPTNFKLGIRLQDDDPHQPQGRGHTLSAEPGSHTSCIFFSNCIKVSV